MSCKLTLNFSVYICDMKSDGNTRTYTLGARAEVAEKTAQKIIDATISLWGKLPIHEITLDKVAEKAGVTTRTILRKYNSKEGLFEACAEQDSKSLIIERDKAPVGNVRDALDFLHTHYDTYGDANIRTLGIEGELPIAKKILLKGRKHHKEWCARVFAPYLPKPSHPDFESHLMAYYAATDVYQWKLMRRDFGKTKEEALNTMLRLVEGLINLSQQT